MSRAHSDSLPLVGGFHVGPLFVIVIQKTARQDNRGPARVRKVRNRKPQWADADAISQVYAAAKRATERTGVQHSVDHIVPIEHPLVCGLHVEWNLNVKPLTENLRKSNHHWPDMWGEQMELI